MQKCLKQIIGVILKSDSHFVKIKENKGVVSK